MMKFLGLTAFLLIVAGIVATVSGGFDSSAPAAAMNVSMLNPPAGMPAADWRRSKVWDDGLAEYSAFEIKWRRYGRLYEGRSLMVTVKEPWRSDREVKADRSADAEFDVIKLNHIRSVKTGIYRYEQMASAFMRRKEGSLQKLATSSAEACGLSTAHMTKGRLELRSYFDGQAEREMAWPAAAIPEDALAMFLRDYVAGTPPAKLSIFPSTLHGRFPPTQAAELAVTKVNLPGHRVPAGTFDAVEIRLGGEEGERYIFEKASPHRCLEIKMADGTHYRLAKTERLAYWEYQEKADANWWPESLR